MDGRQQRNVHPQTVGEGFLMASSKESEELRPVSPESDVKEGGVEDEDKEGQEGQEEVEGESDKDDLSQEMVAETREEEEGRGDQLRKSEFT